MAWVRVDEKFTSGPKAKRAAMKLGGKFPRRRILSVWLEAMSYCNLHTTDGFVPDYEVEGFEDEWPLKVFEAMSHGDDKLGAIVDRDDERGGWVFRNYLDYQPSRASVEEKSAQERERKAKWRLSRKCPNGTKPDGTQTSAPTGPDRTGPDRSRPIDQELVSAAADPTALMDAWNHGTGLPIPKCRELSDKRRKHAIARLRERPLEEWVQVIARINASQFCRGQNDRGWAATFDWLLQPDTAVKVLEGKYDNRLALTTKAARTMAAGARLDAFLDAGGELDPFGTKADERKRLERWAEEDRQKKLAGGAA